MSQEMLLERLPPWLDGAAAAEAAARNAAAGSAATRLAARVAWRQAEREAEAAARRPFASSPRAFTVLVCAVALMNDEGRVLLAQRPVGKNHAGCWEFPGGKVRLMRRCYLDSQLLRLLTCT